MVSGEKKLKWLLLTNYVHRNLIEGEECLRTGLYSWLPVFDGEVRRYPEVDPSEYQNYDIIQVNMSGQDMFILGEVRKVLGWNSKTKLVANNDYTVELWQGSFEYLPAYAQAIANADMVFGTEPNQVETMQVLTKRKVHLITHPCFVKRLKTMSTKKPQKYLSVVSHRYDNYNSVPSLSIKGLGHPTRLIGYDRNSDKLQYSTMIYYEDIKDATNYMDFCDQLLESKVVVDPFTLTSQNRTGWDCAAMGIPMVGSDRTYSVQQCFPFTSCSPFDIGTMRKMVKRLLEDEEFRKKVIDYAKEKVEMVSYESSKAKYLAALEEGSPSIDI